MSEIAPILSIALRDAATNCERDSAVATITLRSGVQLSGELEYPNAGDPGSVHLIFEDRGWATVLAEEVAAVEAHPRRQQRRGSL